MGWVPARLCTEAVRDGELRPHLMGLLAQPHQQPQPQGQHGHGQQQGTSTVGLVPWAFGEQLGAVIWVSWCLGKRHLGLRAAQDDRGKGPKSLLHSLEILVTGPTWVAVCTKCSRPLFCTLVGSLDVVQTALWESYTPVERSAVRKVLSVKAQAALELQQLVVVRRRLRAATAAAARARAAGQGGGGQSPSTAQAEVNKLQVQ